MSMGVLDEQASEIADAAPIKAVPRKMRRRHMAKHGSKVGGPPQHFER
jgi:hypothetical protein